MGGGPLEDVLRAEAAEKQIADRVFLTGPRADAWELMGAADAVVLPSRGEGLPLTVLEALAIGTPLVATDVRGVRGLVEDGRTALLVPPDDPQALAEALGRVLTDENLARRLVSQGRQLAAGFDDKRMAQLYLDLYKRLVARDT
jgi:glycosyltransferase involved in cell wall biosynthesis